jgi:hypothetical protein
LLKEKGFDVPTLAYRQKSAKIGDETILPLCLPDAEFFWDTYDWNHYQSEVPYYSIPEQHQVVEWLRVNHGIFISCEQNYKGEFWTQFHKKSDTIIPRWEVIAANYDSPNSPQEAYSAAFDHILKHLI